MGEIQYTVDEAKSEGLKKIKKYRERKKEKKGHNQVLGVRSQLAACPARLFYLFKGNLGGGG